MDDTHDAHHELWEKIKDVRIAMLTTRRADGLMRSRPMATQETAFDGRLWFATDADCPKAAEIEANPEVHVAYAAPDKDLYVSVSGSARVVRDAGKMRELWNPMLKAWFPDGPDDPDLVLIEVHAEEAEYWHNRQPKVLQLARMAKAAVTGRRPKNMGEDRKLSF